MPYYVAMLFDADDRVVRADTILSPDHQSALNVIAHLRRAAPSAVAHQLWLNGMKVHAVAPDGRRLHPAAAFPLQALRTKT
jgi:hypothetical protein